MRSTGRADADGTSHRIINFIWMKNKILVDAWSMSNRMKKKSTERIILQTRRSYCTKRVSTRNGNNKKIALEKQIEKKRSNMMWKMFFFVFRGRPKTARVAAATLNSIFFALFAAIFHFNMRNMHIAQHNHSPKQFSG